MSAYGLLTLFTVFMAFRYGISGFTTYLATAGFLIVVAIAFIISGSYFTTVDWSTNVPLFATSLPGF